MQNIFSDNSNLLWQIVTNKSLHARFLNTLSLMEFCGAQRISTAIPYLTADSFLLEHVAEEYRHAYFLRRLANKFLNAQINSFDKKTVFCISKSKNYIRHIDFKIYRLLRDEHSLNPSRHLCYLLSTYVIEHRALPFYNYYQSVLDRCGMPINVKSIISEESKHLEKMSREISNLSLASITLRQCFKIENQCFSNWVKNIAEEI
jgi:hypothetical protein